ncbi:filamentous hemagglutinin N-terminal domain-containing protein [Campylobacter jejuni]
MKKMSKHIVLSFAVSSLLFSQAYALPSGGKFTHGSTGSISSSNGTMNITGNKGAGTSGNNFVIQWGGGFNIGQNESVKFNGNQQNYLNIAYQKDASKIDGKLDGGTNNIFLVNPMGVLIGTNGSIIANKFVASTTALSDENVKTFLNQGANFSPIFNPNKQGNIVNLGTINADNIVLIGNKVEIGNGGRINGKDGTSNAKEARLVGNYVYVNVGKENGKNTINANSLKGTAIKEGFLQRDMTSFAGDNYQFGDFKNIEEASYNGASSVDFTKAITIGGYYNGSQLDNKANAEEWKLFADGWNRQNITGDIFKDDLTTIRLISDIDFSGYYTNGIDPVGAVIAFSGKFDGGGYTLKNLTIKAQNTSTEWNTGIFGKVQGANDKKAQIYNLTIDGLSFSGATNSGGGFVAQSKDAEFYNIHLKNYNDLNFYDFGDGQDTFGGGFVGYADSGSKFENITLKNFGTIKLTPNKPENSEFINSYLGGFVGYDNGGVYQNILLDGFKDIRLEGYGNAVSFYTGGFIGYSKNSSFKNITLNNFGNIYSGYLQNNFNGSGQIFNSIAGGFAGVIDGDDKLNIENISLNNFKDIDARRAVIYYQDPSYLAAAGGFAGMIKLGNQVSGSISNIFLNFDNNKIYAQKTISGTTIRSDSDYAGGFAGLFKVGNLNSFTIENVDLKFGGKVQIDTYSGNNAIGTKNRGIFTGYVDNVNLFKGIYKTIRVFYIANEGGLLTNYTTGYWDTSSRLGGLFSYLKYNDFSETDGNLILYAYNKSDENNEKANNLIREKFAKLDNNGNVNFYNPSATNNQDIPSIKNPTEWSKDDFDPKLLQRILDDIFNGKYVYKLGDDWYIDLGNNQLVKWSEFIKNDGGKYSDNAIYQSINFLSSFEGSDIDKNFKDTWNNDSSQSYKDYTNLYNAYNNKFSTSNVDSKYEDYQETLNKYQEIIDSMNKILGDNSYTNRLQGLIDSIKNYNEASKALDAQINEFQKAANALQAQIDDYNKNANNLDSEAALKEYNKILGKIQDFTAYQNELKAQKNELLAQFNQINSEKGALDQIYNDLLNQKANGDVNEKELDQLKQALADLKLDSLVKNPDHSLSSIGKDADGKAFTGSYVFSGALKDPSKIPSFDKPTDNTYAQNNTNIPSLEDLKPLEPDEIPGYKPPVNPDKPDKPDIDDKPTLPDQKPDEGGDNPNQGGDNTVDIDNDTSNVIYADNQGQDKEEDEEENKLGLDETQAQEKGVLCVVSDDFRTMNICAIK